MKVVVGVGCLLGATLVVACGTGTVIPDLPGINTIALRSRVVVPQGLDAWTPVLEVDASPDLADLRIVTREGIRWIDGVGQTLRELKFSVAVGFGAAARTLRDGGVPTYAVFDPGKRSLWFFDADGRQIHDQPCRDCWDLVAADLEGDGHESLVVRVAGARAARSFSARGAAGVTFQAGGVLAYAAAVRIEGDPADGLVFDTDRAPTGTGVIRVLRGDGTERARWSLQAGRVVAAGAQGGGAGTVVARDGDVLTEHDALTGATLWRAVVPSSSSFKWVHAGRWREDRRVLVLVGGASVNKHMVVVADGSGTLLYRKTADARAYDLDIPSRSANGFCVASVSRVACYEVSGQR